MPNLIDGLTESRVLGRGMDDGVGVRADKLIKEEETKEEPPEPLNSIDWHLQLMRLDEYEMFTTLLYWSFVRCL